MSLTLCIMTVLLYFWATTIRIFMHSAAKPELSASSHKMTTQVLARTLQHHSGQLEQTLGRI